MAYLVLGTALEWSEAEQHAAKIRNWGIQQLLALWRQTRDKENDVMLWGDEVEYLVVDYDPEKPRVVLSLRQEETLRQLEECPDTHSRILADAPTYHGHHENENGNGNGGKRTPATPIYHPEFGRFMLESTPGEPWGTELRSLLDVELDMKLRRRVAKSHMLPTEYPITMTVFPRLGSPGVFTNPVYPTSGPRLRSQFVPDEIAFPHTRFRTLAANIRSRRGRKVQVNVPVFHDTRTSRPWRDPTVNYELHNWPEDDDVRQGAAPADHIHMDAMAFGMGSCCVQVTLQAKNIDEGRTLYDQLMPLVPVFLALTAATPIYKGFLADTDVRWNQVCNSVDCRSPEELGEKPLAKARWRIPKSRCASNSTYISVDGRLRPEYQDPDLVVDHELKKKLMADGMDDVLATHFAHLFIRDPLVVFEEDLQARAPDLTATNHFESLQSTNWQSLRFKPPPSATSSIGWRVEFRPMEIQITDFENAALSVLIVLVSRAILAFQLNLYIPIRKVDENIERAQRRDAVLNDKFFFRKDIFPSPRSAPNGVTDSHDPEAQMNGNGTGVHDHGTMNGTSSSTPQAGPVEEEYTEMSINEIINGSRYAAESTARANGQSNGNGGHDDPGSRVGRFPGLIPLVERYLDSMNVDVDTRRRLDRYLDFVRKRASGASWTAARWIRHFVDRHPDYHHDSAVSETVTKDLIHAVISIGQQELADADDAHGNSPSADLKQRISSLDIPGIQPFLGEIL